MTYEPNAEPNNKRPTHHAVLIDDDGNKVGLIAITAGSKPDAKQIKRTTVERSSLKTSTGDMEYSDMRPPYTTTSQKDWSGGRGNLDFTKDATRFLDSNRAETERLGRIVLGGRDRYGAPDLRSQVNSLPTTGGMKLVALYGATPYMAKRFTPVKSFTSSEGWVWLRYVGTPGSDLTIRLRQNSGGNPGTVIATATVAANELNAALISELWVEALAGAVTAGGTYWLETYADANDNAENHWEVGCRPTSGTSKESPDGSAWVDSAYDLYFRLTAEAEDENPGRFFEYKRLLHFITTPWDGSASRLFINGICGKTSDGASFLEKIFGTDWVNNQPPGLVTEWSLEANELAGGVVVIVDGPGQYEEHNWRTITGNTASGGAFSISTSPDWIIPHTTATEWVVVGVDKWVELDVGNHIQASVSDLTIVREGSGGYVVFAMGQAQKLQFMRRIGMTLQWATIVDPGTKGEFVGSWEKDNVHKLFLIKGNMISSSNAPVWAQIPLTVDFQTGKNVGDANDRVNGHVGYVDANESPIRWIFTESGLFTWDGSKVDKINIIEEITAIRSEMIGRVSFRQNVYLYFTAMKSIWNYYNKNFEDVGPMLDEGLPANRQGYITGGVAYPGRVTVCYDANTGYSSVLTKAGGWHERYRAPKGKRIHAIAHQSIPGSAPDRLWIRQGGDFVWIPYPSDTFDPWLDAAYPYVHESVVEFSDMTSGLLEASKYYKALKAHTENMIEGVTWMEMDYKLNDGVWQTLGTQFITSPMQTVDLDKNGQKTRLRLRLYSTDAYESPRVKAVSLDAVVVTAPKFAWTFPARVREEDLNGEEDSSLTPWDKIKQLDAWAGSARPLTLQCVNPLYDGAKVFLSPLPASPVASQELPDMESKGKWTYDIQIVLQEA